MTNQEPISPSAPHQPPTPPLPAHYRKRHRLTHAREFQAVYDANIRKHRGPITIFTLPNTHPWPRLGLSIGARVGPAVERNRLKRLLREAIRLEQHALAQRADGTCYDAVITCRPHDFLPLAAYRKALRELIAAGHAAWERQP